MTSLISKIINGHKYYYAVESARVDGKPRIVSQVCLRTAESLLEASRLLKSAVTVTPEYSEVLELGAVSALFDVSQRLGISDIIDDVVGKSVQGHSVGDSLVLEAICRAVAPVSKNSLFENFFAKTVLPKIFHLSDITNFPDMSIRTSMSLITPDQIRQIEDEILTHIISSYNISTDYLLFDTLDITTFSDSDNQSQHSMEGMFEEQIADFMSVKLLLRRKLNVSTQLEAVAGGLNTTCGKSGPAGAHNKSRATSSAGTPVL
jgi:hypothetical protein